MSDTPRTDKQVAKHRFPGGGPLELDGPFADFARELERENALLRGTVEALGDANDRLTIEVTGLRKDKERLDLLNAHCMSADPIMGRSTYRWTIEHDEPDIRDAIDAARTKEGGAT